MNIQADGAGMTLFRGIKSLQPAPLLNGIVQWEQFRILKRLFAFQNNQRLLGFRTTSESRSARFGTIRLRAPAEIASARRSETPKQVRVVVFDAEDTSTTASKLKSVKRVGPTDRGIFPASQAGNGRSLAAIRCRERRAPPRDVTRPPRRSLPDRSRTRTIRPRPARFPVTRRVRRGRGFHPRSSAGSHSVGMCRFS
jgi:hypothetical protein